MVKEKTSPDSSWGCLYLTMVGSICFHCEKRIEKIEDDKMYGLDIPYINLYFHKHCFIEVGGYGNISVYLSENQKKVYNYLHKVSERNKK